MTALVSEQKVLSGSPPLGGVCLRPQVLRSDAGIAKPEPPTDKDYLTVGGTYVDSEA